MVGKGMKMIKIIVIYLLIMLNINAESNKKMPILMDTSNYKIFVSFTGDLAFLGCYADALPFNINGLAPVSLDGNSWVFINTDGKKIKSNSFESVDEYADNGLAAASVNGKFGFIDTNGKWVIKAKFDETYKFDSIDNNLSLAMAWIDEKHGYINQKGEWVIKPIFGSHYDTGFENGVAMVSPVNSSFYGLIDAKGNWILKPQYEWDTAGDIQTYKGHFTLIKNGKWGVVNTQGKWIVEPKYDYILSAEKNGYMVERNNKKIFIQLKENCELKTNKSEVVKNTKALSVLLMKYDSCEEFLKQAKQKFPNLK